MFHRPQTDVTYVLFTNAWDMSRGLESIKDQLHFMGVTANKVLAKLGY